MMKYILLFTIAFWVLPSFAKPLVFGIVPQQSAKKMAARWTPILDHVSQKSGVKLVFATAKNIPTFEKRLANGDYDIAYMNPYHFVVYHEKTGYQALLKQANKQIKGIIVMRKDADFANLGQLNNLKMAFPAPAAFAASIIPRAEIAKQNINISPMYVSSHDSVYMNVAKGFFPAGGGVMRTFNNIPASLRDQLKVVWTTSPYTPHAIATHPNVNAELRNKILSAFVEMSSYTEGQSLLSAINFKLLEKANNQDWDDVRSLDIGLLK